MWKGLLDVVFFGPVMLTLRFPPPPEELKEKLTEYVDKVNGQKPGFIKIVRHSKQEGLIRSRVSGWRAATAPVVALFDAHVEFNVGWYVSLGERYRGFSSCIWVQWLQCILESES